jgi:apolipoprotein N-acyltransferase
VVGVDASITPGTYVGHWVGRLAGPLTVLAIMAAALGYRRRRTPETPTRAAESAPRPAELTRP